MGVPCAAVGLRIHAQENHMSNHRSPTPHPFLVASLAMATLVNCGHDESANSTADSADSTVDSTASSNSVPPGPEETPTAPAGTITVRVVDAPADVKELWVVVDSVSFKRCDGDGWSDRPVGGIAVDLIAVAAGWRTCPGRDRQGRADRRRPHPPGQPARDPDRPPTARLEPLAAGQNRA